MKKYIARKTQKYKVPKYKKQYNLEKEHRKVLRAIWEFCHECCYRNGSNCKGYNINPYKGDHTTCELLKIFSEYEFKFSVGGGKT